MNVIIAGATSGIGLELVKKYLSQGDKVFAIGRNIDSLTRLKVEFDLTLHVLKYDLTQIDSDLSFQNAIKEHFDCVDILIMNAGLLYNKSIKELSYDEIRSMIATNFTSNICLIKTLELLLLNSKRAHVINIGSVGGVQGSVKFPGLATYSSSKSASSTLMECMAEEYKESNITFNSLALGAVNTSMLRDAFPDYEAEVQPEEMARYIYNFSKEACKFMNGKIVSVSLSTP